MLKNPFLVLPNYGNLICVDTDYEHILPIYIFIYTRKLIRIPVNLPTSFLDVSVVYNSPRFPLAIKNRTDFTFH